MADGIYKELKELGDRGRDNKKQLADRVRDTKNFFNKAIKAESEDAEYKYEWLINGNSFETRTVGPIVFELDEGEIPVELKQMDAKTGKLLAFYTTHVTISHFRRTLGELNAADRMKFFSSVQKMYELPTEEGRKEYGKYYVGMQDVWAAHNFFAVDHEHYLLGEGGDEEGSKKLLNAAAQHGRLTHSYRKQVQRGDDASFMEIDADLNEYTEKNRKGKTPNAIFSAEFGRAEDKIITLQKAAKQNHMLINSQHAEMMTNFATFSSWFEKAVQSVDPSVSLPYFDEEGELGGTNFASSIWREKYVASSSSVNLIGGAAAAECKNGDKECKAVGVGSSSEDEERIVQVETEGKYTYVPIITHQETRFENGKDVAISKGFSVPLITKQGEKKKNTA